MTREQLIEAFEMRLDGYTYKEIGEHFGLTKQRVSFCLGKVLSERTCDSIYPNLSREIKFKDETLEEFSKSAGIEFGHFAAMVRGKIKPTGDDVIKCCKYLQKDCVYLFERSDSNA